MGEAGGFRVEDEVAGAEEVEKGGGGAGVEVWVAGGCLEEAVEAGELFEEEERHGERPLLGSTL